MAAAIVAGVAAIAIFIVAIGTPCHGGRYRFMPLRCGIEAVTTGTAAAVTGGAGAEITVPA
jgi:hypothetical protein